MCGATSVLVEEHEFTSRKTPERGVGPNILRIPYKAHFCSGVLAFHGCINDRTIAWARASVLGGFPIHCPFMLVGITPRFMNVGVIDSAQVVLIVPQLDQLPKNELVEMPTVTHVRLITLVLRDSEAINHPNFSLRVIEAPIGYCVCCSGVELRSAISDKEAVQTLLLSDAGVALHTSLRSMIRIAFKIFSDRRKAIHIFIIANCVRVHEHDR
jgi:hypothetical protein